MKVSIVSSGGVAGLALVTDADTDSGLLSPQDAEQLRAKVEEAGVFDLPSNLMVGSPQPDRFDYTVIVEDEGRKHTFVAREQSVPDSVRDLVSYVKNVKGSVKKICQPGDLPVE